MMRTILKKCFHKLRKIDFKLKKSFKKVFEDGLI